MIDYHLCTWSELYTFARDRKLEIIRDHATDIDIYSLRAPQMGELIIALEKADKKATFRLLDLPAELRQKVYEKLLIFPEHSMVCEPAILATSKFVYREANENVFEIAVHGNGVSLHGQRCGIFEPKPTYVPSAQFDIANLLWPQWLRHVKFLKIEFVDLGQNYLCAHDLPRLATVHTILISLCTFLHGDHQLRRVNIHLGNIGREIFQRTQSCRYFVQNFRDTLYPICLLGEGIDFCYPNLPRHVSTCLARYVWVKLSASADQISTEFDSMYTVKLIQYCQAADVLYIHLKGAHILYHTPASPGHAMARLQHMLGRFRWRKTGYNAACRALKRGFGKLPHSWWRKHYGSLMVKLRKYWHQVSPMFVHQGKLEKIQALLRVDVHLRMPAEMRQRLVEEAGAAEAIRSAARYQGVMDS